ncbi:MAG: phage tail sheath subtilisin-like domain-containing protein [Bacteroidota bacterium]|nr:phage tail sheath subtilisin-like domain-containing protein [Bacteroidota bacterium]
MALSFTTPGVYIQEVPVFAPSVTPVATAIPAFIGYTEKQPTGNLPTRVSSFTEFVSLFGGPNLEAFTATVVDNILVTPNTRSIVSQLTSQSPFILYYAMQLYFANGGGPCYVISVDLYAAGSITYANVKIALDKLEKVDEPTLILCPDMVNDSADYGRFVQDTLSQCAKLQDRFGVFDYPANTMDFSPSGDVEDFRGSFGANNLKYGAVYAPFLNSVFNFGIKTTGTNLTLIENGTSSTSSLSTIVTLNPALYNQVIANINSTFHVTLPPSSAMVGIYAAVDNDRGVWKAPANVSVNSIFGPTVPITEAQQGLLNVDATSGKSINVIRAFVGRGTLVWGSRTLDGNSNEWRYVPVRRLFIMAEESIKKACEFVVFESNDKNTWLRLKGSITNFLTDLWKQGALAGDKPEQAFFVRIGLNETMTAQDILEGKLIVQIGMAAVRPAEFIVLQFMHKLQEA